MNGCEQEFLVKMVIIIIRRLESVKSVYLNGLLQNCASAKYHMTGLSPSATLLFRRPTKSSALYFTGG